MNAVRSRCYRNIGTAVDHQLRPPAGFANNRQHRLRQPQQLFSGQRFFAKLHKFHALSGPSPRIGQQTSQSRFSGLPKARSIGNGITNQADSVAPDTAPGYS